MEFTPTFRNGAQEYFTIALPDDSSIRIRGGLRATVGGILVTDYRRGAASVTADLATELYGIATPKTFSYVNTAINSLKEPFTKNRWGIVNLSTRADIARGITGIYTISPCQITSTESSSIYRPTGKVVEHIPLSAPRMYLLSSLTEGALFGNEMHNRALDLSDGAVDIEPGNLYPLLSKLVQAGLLDTDKREGPNRRYTNSYELTPFGKRVLRAESHRLLGITRHITRTLH